MKKPDEQMALTGAEYIRDFASRLPGAPGVYRMLNGRGEVLYVGKARDLKKRVTSYATKGALPTRILSMVAQTAQMEIITTRSEAEALLVEANLIKKLKPLYNILLKDDKSYPYILLHEGHAFPRLLKHRGAQTLPGKYFGPFASVGAVNQTLSILQRAFLLRPCPDSVFKNRTRPCLQYQIKRCSAPCVGYIGEAEYRRLMDQAEAFLSGKSREIQDQLVREMEALSEAEQFEKAAVLRDRIRALSQVQQEQAIAFSPGLPDADVIACLREGDGVCVQVFFIRGGQTFGNRSFFPTRAQEQSEGEILEAFIGQFYQKTPPPALLLLSHMPPQPDVLEEALELHAHRRVRIEMPQRGEKMRVLAHVTDNARHALSMHMAERASQSRQLRMVQEFFALKRPPQRIEVYDNSHIMGTHAVGAMITAGPEGFEKNSYRRYTIRRSELTPGDDYAMMREVLTRRFSRLAREDADRSQGMWPDLVLIDGGLGHMHTVEEVFRELGIAYHSPSSLQGEETPSITFACIAKGPERNAGREQFFIPGKKPFQLPVGDPLLHYLQRLRDEAHRFAVSSHRIKRAAALRGSELDNIPGIGPKRKKALLHHFGSAKDVEAASMEAIASTPGFNAKTAKIVYDFFHG